MDVCNWLVSLKERVMASRLRDTPLLAMVNSCRSRAWTAMDSRLLKPRLGKRSDNCRHPSYLLILKSVLLMTCEYVAFQEIAYHKPLWFLC